MCSVFCFQDNDPEGSGNSASSQCASSEFTDRQLPEDSQSGTGSAHQKVPLTEAFGYT